MLILKLLLFFTFYYKLLLLLSAVATTICTCTCTALYRYSIVDCSFRLQIPGTWYWYPIAGTGIRYTWSRRRRRIPSLVYDRSTVTVGCRLLLCTACCLLPVLQLQLYYTIVIPGRAPGCILQSSIVVAVVGCRFPTPMYAINICLSCQLVQTLPMSLQSLQILSLSSLCWLA